MTKKVESFDLARVGELDAVAIFTGDYLDQQTALARELLKSFVPDVSTNKGRDAIKSFSRQYATVKVRVDEAGKGLGSDLRDELAKINATRNSFKSDWQEMQDEARKPLTDWEVEDQKRIDDEKKAIELELDHIEGLRMNDEVDRTRELERKEKEIAAKEESLRLAEVERLAKIATEEAEKSRIKREEEIRMEAAAQAQRDAQAEIDRLKQAKIDADVQAETDRLQAIEDVKQQEIDTAKEVERLKLLAEQETERKVQAERDRIAAEKLAEEKAAELREADTKHKAKINNEAAAALTLIFSDIHCGNQKEAEALAKAAITAFARGHIPHITISY